MPKSGSEGSCSEGFCLADLRGPQQTSAFWLKSDLRGDVKWLTNESLVRDQEWRETMFADEGLMICSIKPARRNRASVFSSK